MSSDDDPPIVEIRGVDDIDEATLPNVWIAGQPVGKLLDRQQKRIKKQEEKIEELRSKLADTEQTAQSALGVAQAKERADGGEMSKTEQALVKSRNRLLKEAALNRTDQQIPVSTVQEMCRPQVDPAYQTVKDAWNELASRWSCFYIDANEAGLKVLRVDRERVPDQLAHAVSEDLGREDIAKRLISQRKSGGG